MATIVPVNGRTRAASTPPPFSPQRKGTPSAMAGRRSAKRRVEYPDDEASPAKRHRSASSDSAENSSPTKRVPTKSFYGRGRGRYLNPLERKDLLELKSKTLPPRGSNKQDDQNTLDSIKKPTPPLTVKSVPKNNKKASRGKKIKSQGRAAANRKTATIKAVVRNTSPLQEILPGMPKSPVRNKIPVKEETRVYSPSRSGRKFFKSRRVSDTSGQPSAVVQRNSLHLKYKPTAVVNKPKEETEKPTAVVNKPKEENEKPKLLHGMVLPKHSPSTVKMKAFPNSPASNTRSSPRKQKLSQGSSGRSTIPSSKNPGSQELFSPSDWDFEDDDDSVVPSVSSSLGIKKTVANDSVLSQSADSGQASRDSEISNVSVNCDSVALLSEFSEDMSITSELSSRDQNDTSTEVQPSPTTKGKFYSIFKTRTPSASVTSSPSSTQSTPHSRRRRKGGPGSAAKLGKSPKLRSLVDKNGKEQLTLDFGQRLKGAVQCDKCGMTYNHGQPSDEATHKKFHDKLLAVLKFPGWKHENVLQEFMDGSRIIVIMPDDKKAIKKVAAVKKIVDEDLGFVVDAQGIKPNSKVFMYISEDRRITGFCIAESINSAYRVVGDSENKSASQDDGVSRPWCCSTEAEKARCGINRIWVLKSDRRCGTASKLLDCVSVNFLLGFPLKKTDLAFTDPTPDGRAFATRYTGTPCFLVYKHSSL